jgi:hypothetical protein
VSSRGLVVGKVSRQMKITFPAVALFVVLLLLALARYRQGPEPVPVNEGALKILIEEDGFYRIDPHSLRQANVALESFAAESLQLSQAGRPVPFYLDEESLIFYGQAPDNRYSDSRPYVLRIGQVGRVMDEASLPAVTQPQLDLAPHVLYLEENRIYDSRAAAPGGAPDAGYEPWFWQTIQVQAKVTVEFELAAVADGPATLRVGLWGATEDVRLPFDHDFDLIVNGRNLETVRWKGSVYHISEVALPAGTLQAGTNTVVLDNTIEGATLIDIMRLDWMEVSYLAPAQVTADRFDIWDSEGVVNVAGFSGRPLLFNLADPEAPVVLTGWNFSDGQADFGVTADLRVVAVGPRALREPAAISGLRRSDWRVADNQADFIIVTTDELAPALEPLVAARQAEGLSVAVVPAAEIYDEFGFGEVSPESIHQFISYAATSWSEPAPRYLLLVGQATYDYRGYLGERPKNEIPTFMVPVTYGGETVSDGRLADITGDTRADLAVGRWPVDSSAAVAGLVERTLAYEQNEAPGQALFVADGSSLEFTQLSDNVAQGSRFPEAAMSRLYGSSATEVTQAWNNGAWLVTYSGHGSLERWGKEDVFSSAHVPSLAGKAAAAIVVHLTCLTGFFAHPSIPSLSEVMLSHKGGPVLLIAATSLTLSSSQSPFAISLLQELQDERVARIGDALQNAKASLSISENNNLREISDTFGLLGDPSARIIRPEFMRGGD